MDVDENVNVTRPKAPAKPGQEAEVYNFFTRGFVLLHKTLF